MAEPVLATQATNTNTYWDFASRKLHSLLGVIPLGFFLAEHLIANATAMKGEAAFNETVNFIQGLPLLLFLEIFFIALPLLFHGIYGVIFAVQSKNNVKLYPTLRNWMFYFQRITGLLTAAFVIYHVYTIRFGTDDLSMYERITTAFSDPIILGIYIVALLSALFHFINGLWNFALNWGLVIGLNSQKYFSYVMIALFFVSAYFGLQMAFAFVH
ncbi:succinate dehydrogenase subunit C [Desulfonispora thiosulfatigenes DSM 11270]|uniref:Succinate dehydrogenase subunit C n=1 Tax=Desulfonispora thiosulfatigenes DSM 11270 TaxID=656914 RepID=A0A1W1V769_DESTI|nr:hypothetical protein [Desulfonispora thiosulfatigenes]SMB89145.1 succinate dehydrogenase subunit C [Desulfonispora thiosulfatigenes DSM 11270]